MFPLFPSNSQNFRIQKISNDISFYDNEKAAYVNILPSWTHIMLYICLSDPHFPSDAWHGNKRGKEGETETQQKRSQKPQRTSTINVKWNFNDHVSVMVDFS